MSTFVRMDSAVCAPLTQTLLSSLSQCHCLLLKKRLQETHYQHTGDYCNKGDLLYNCALLSLCLHPLQPCEVVGLHFWKKTGLLE